MLFRSYNFPQSRVTDHRINVTLHSLSDFMEGDLGEMVEALLMAETTERLEAMAAEGR